MERGGEFAAGTWFVPPVEYWHALRPRDAQASAALRALTDGQAGEIVRAAAQALAEQQAAQAAAGAVDGTSQSRSLVPTADEVVQEIVSRLLPALGDRRLVAGVGALVRAVLRLAESTAAFVAPPVAPKTQSNRINGMFADLKPEHGDDQTLREAVTGITPMQGWSGGETRWASSAADPRREPCAVREAGRRQGPARGLFVRRRPRRLAQRRVHRSGIGPVWTPVLDVLRPLAYRAACPTTTVQHREALLLLLEAIADGPLAVPAGTLREVVLSEPHEKQERVGQVLRRDGRTVVVLGCRSVDRQTGRVNWLALDQIRPAGSAR